MTTGIRSIGDEITVRRASANVAATAAGAGDNTLVTGVIIDRAAIGWPESVVIAVPFTATLAASQTLSIGLALQHGETSNLADAAAFLTVAPTVVATGVGTVTGTFEQNLRLTGARRYVRLNFTPDLSAGATDTAALSSVLVFGGAGRLPQ